MSIYSNVYNYGIYLKLLVFLCALCIQEKYDHNFKHLLKISINNHTLLCRHINNCILVYTHKVITIKSFYNKNL